MQFQRIHQPRPEPIAFSPIGLPLIRTKELPPLGVPGRFRVLEDAFEIDGWVFPYENLTRGVLEWLRDRFVEWRSEDMRDENLEWLEAILDTLQQSLCDSIERKEG